MRDRTSVSTPLWALVLVALAVLLSACGGGSPPREDPAWRARERVPDVAERWWWEPVERACEEDNDCRRGETCRNMRLATCSNCPRGEQARICVGEDNERSRQRPRAQR